MNTAFQSAAGPTDQLVVPRRYGTGRGAKVGLLSCGLFVTVLGALGFWYFTFGQPADDSAAKWVFTPICCVFVVIATYACCWVLRARIVLSRHEIEVRGAWLTRSLQAQEIAGWRMTQDWILEPKAGRSLRISHYFALDETFYEWFYGFDNLDEHDQQNSADEILKNEELGVTPDQRIAALERGKKVAYALNAATFVLLG